MLLNALTEHTKLIFIVNPNNPTSNILLEESDLRRILATEKIVVVDEAYVEFGGWSSAQLIEEFRNLIVLRSLSKSMALPGLRVAMVLADPELTLYLKRIEDNIEIFNIPVIALRGAIAALEDLEHYRKVWASLPAYRDRMKRDLEAMDAKVLDSKTTFLFITTKGVKSIDLRDSLAKQGIIIKNMRLYKNVQEDESVIGLPSPNSYELVIAALRGALHGINR
jgi:histidinol-phosphate aminotransferase